MLQLYSRPIKLAPPRRLAAGFPETYSTFAHLGHPPLIHRQCAKPQSSGVRQSCSDGVPWPQTTPVPRPRRGAGAGPRRRSYTKDTLVYCDRGGVTPCRRRRRRARGGVQCDRRHELEPCEGRTSRWKYGDKLSMSSRDGRALAAACLLTAFMAPFGRDR